MTRLCYASFMIMRTYSGTRATLRHNKYDPLGLPRHFVSTPQLGNRSRIHKFGAFLLENLNLENEGRSIS